MLSLKTNGLGVDKVKPIRDGLGIPYPHWRHEFGPSYLVLINLSILDADILIMMQQLIFGWSSRGDHPETLLTL